MLPKLDVETLRLLKEQADPFAFLDDPISKCDRPKCCWWFRTDRKVCPMCKHERGAK